MCLCIVWYIWFYDTIRFIRYNHCIIRFMSTYDMPIRYETFYTRYDTIRYVSYNTDNYVYKYQEKNIYNHIEIIMPAHQVIDRCILLIFINAHYKSLITYIKINKKLGDIIDWDVYGLNLICSNYKIKNYI